MQKVKIINLILEMKKQTYKLNDLIYTKGYTKKRTVTWEQMSNIYELRKSQKKIYKILDI